MKVIDLLNKIANGEEVPRHIKLNNTEWYWNDFDGYVDKWSLSTTPDAQNYLYTTYRLDFCLNKKIEIIEEPKKIEPITMVLGFNGEAQCMKDQLNENIPISHSEEAIIFKINEIIDYINGDNNE